MRYLGHIYALKKNKNCCLLEIQIELGIWHFIGGP